MLRFEASLPRLPVPTLSSTSAKYLETVQPHLTPLEYERTQNIVKSFVQSDLGKKLQERLKARAADPDIKNWLADWWNDVAYMAYRDPVVVYVSYFYVHVDDMWRKDQVKRAAGLVKAILPFRAMVESCVYVFCVKAPSERSPPQRISGTRKDQRRTTRHVLLQVAVSRRDSSTDRNFGTKLSSRFHSCRYPTKPADTAHKFDAAENNHIVFVRKNKFFEVPLAHNGVELSEAELQVYVFAYTDLVTHLIALQLPDKLNG
jgi:carnitine O-acetyltransferase